MRNSTKLWVAGLVAVALGAASTAGATPITTTAAFSGTIEGVIDFSQFAGCVAYGSPPCQNQDVGGLVGEPVLFTGTNGFLGASLYNAGFGLGGNGSWDSGRNGYVGINNQQGGVGIFAEFEFASGISGIGGLLNYAPGEGGSPVMEIYGAGHNLLETVDISVFAPISTPGQLNAGAFRGFNRSSNDIFFVRFTDGFIVLDDLTFARSSVVPEPATLAMLAIGLFSLSVVRKRRG